MSEWEAKYPVKITATEDTIQEGFEKLRQEIPVIYRLLNRLRRQDAGAGQSVSDVEAFNFRIDTTLSRLLIRDAKNEKWIDLGELAENWGITAASIGALERTSDTGRFYFGPSSALPDETDEEATANLKTNDLFLSMNEKKIYRWTGFAWETWMSLNFGDILNYEKYTINRKEVATSGAGKILRLDEETGKANVDITGSPERLLGKVIDAQDLRDGQVLVYNAEKDKFVNLPNYIFTRDDISFTGEPGKIVMVSTADQKAHIDITGSPDKIAGKEVEVENLQDGDVLSFNAASGKIVNRPNYNITKEDMTTTGEAGKILVISNADGKAHVNITGSPDKIAGKTVEVTDIQDGDVLAYDENSGKMVNVPYGGKVGGVPVDATGIKDRQVLIYEEDENKLVPGYIIPTVATAIIPTTGWVAKDNGAYKFYYDIPAASVEEDSFVQVVIDNAQHEVILDCGLSPTCDIRKGFIRVWTISVPAQQINVKYAVIVSRAVVS